MNQTLSNNVYRYQIYGCTLESEIPFPELEPVRKNGHNGQDKISLRLKNFDLPSSFEKESFHGLTYWFGPDQRTIVVDSPLLGQFRLCPQERVIDWKRSHPGSIDFTRAILKGSVLGFFLSHCFSLLILHGSVLAWDGKGIVLCGASQEGKSTLTAALLNEGFSLLSDDVVVIKKRRNAFVVQPGAPEIRLWPQSMGALKPLIQPETFYSQTSKKSLVLNGEGPWQFIRKPVPLRALYFLSRQRKGRNDIRVETLKGQKAVAELLRNLYIVNLLETKVLKRQFELAVKLAQHVALKRIVYPSGFQHLPRVKEVILND